MKAKILKSENDYEAALAHVETLMDAEPGSAEEAELELFTMLIEQYEDLHYPIDLPDPIEAIKFRMEQQGLTRKDMYQYLGSQSKVSEVLNNKRPLSLSMIRALNKGLDIPLEVLIQQSTEKENKELHKDEWNEFFADIYLNCLRQFKGSEEKKLFNWYKNTDKTVINRDLPPFDHRRLNKLFFQKLTDLTIYTKGPQMARELLNNIGIHLIINRPKLDTDLDGFSFYSTTGHPIIGLTLRNNRLDNFWFFLFYQLAHIYLNPESKTTMFLDSLECILDDFVKPEEDKVSNLLRELLIPSNIWETKVLTCVKAKDKSCLDEFIKTQHIGPELISCRMVLEGEDDIYSRLFTPKKVSEELEIVD
jgi:HTH-type transcriptional regulator/antitoxin HigA